MTQNRWQSRRFLPSFSPPGETPISTTRPAVTGPAPAAASTRCPPPSQPSPFSVLRSYLCSATGTRTKCPHAAQKRKHALHRQFPDAACERFAFPCFCPVSPPSFPKNATDWGSFPLSYIVIQHEAQSELAGGHSASRRLTRYGCLRFECDAFLSNTKPGSSWRRAALIRDTGLEDPLYIHVSCLPKICDAFPRFHCSGSAVDACSLMRRL